MASGFGFRRRAGASGGGGGVGAAEEPAGLGRVAGCGCHWRCSFLSVAVGDWLAVDWRLAIWWLAIWWLMVGWASGVGRLDSGCRSYGQGYFACKISCPSFPCPGPLLDRHRAVGTPAAWPDTPPWNRAECVPDPTMVAIPTVWPCCPEPGFCDCPIILPMPLPLDLRRRPVGCGRRVLGRRGLAFGGTSLPWGRVAGLADCQCTASMYAWQGSCVTENCGFFGWFGGRAVAAAEGGVQGRR